MLCSYDASSCRARASWGLVSNVPVKSDVRLDEYEQFFVF